MNIGVVSKLSLFILTIFVFACQNNDSQKIIGLSPIDTKVDSAVVLMYKLYSACETSILENKNGKIDTIAKNISYLCLPVKINTPEVHGDTVLITVFFEPEKGYEIENPKCEFAYSVGFIGPDHYYDFVEFGDNYYTLNSAQLKKANPNLELIFKDKIEKLDCISDQLKRLL